VAEWVDFENCTMPPEGEGAPLHRNALLVTIQHVFVDLGYRCKGFKIENILESTLLVKKYCERREFTPELCGVLSDLVDELEFVARYTTFLENRTGPISL
jgi:hypothetical protein